MAIPKTQTVAWLKKHKPGATLEIRHDVPVPTPGAGEVLIKLEYTGFCHSDVHNIRGELPMTTNVPGHEGVGRVVQVGPNTPADIVGKRVGVKWIYSTCKNCTICKIRYTNCPNQNNSGRNVPGTFQQYVVSPADFVSIIPESLKPEAAAPLLCAGVTMIGALKKLDKLCEKGDWVVIVGAGGGLGHLGVQIGKELGYRIIAVDSASKKDICMDSGAIAFVDFTQEDAHKQIQDLTDGLGAHAVIVVVGVENGYHLGVKLLRPTGTLVCVGIPRMDFHIPISPLDCINRGYNVVGSAVGTEDELQELLQMAADGRVSTHYEVFDFDKANEVMERLARYEVKGRVVLRIP
ncbi:hypothetical protein VTN77DRAFT_9647 [Rasamsonia byssochlamydoides]|uniref:uncharacterized protein n=1 Tax=Rasamsonia byssochlamydoides TaxID=89139 RepID=UPI003741EC22